MDEAAVSMHDDDQNAPRFPTRPRRTGRPRDDEDRRPLHFKGFRIDDSQLEYLKRVARITGASEADILRAALDEYRSRHPVD